VAVTVSPIAIAIGDTVTATGTGAVAIGNGSTANFSGSAAIGTGAVATRANQQAFGTAANTYTMAGIGSAASKAVQNGPTQIVTADAAGNLATTTLGALGIASTGDITAINNQLASLQTQINSNLREARAGTALALAATGLHYDPRPGKFSVAVSYGNFKGLSGLAAGLGYAVTDRVRVNGAFTASPDQNDYGGVVGASFTLN
jgi:autotransporter adhesin